MMKNYDCEKLEISRTKNTIRNIFSGLLNRLVSIILPFINRTVILYSLGTEFTGLSSLFTSILQVLNLAELGFSTAIVYSLYKPMSEKNEKEICETVSLFKKIYDIIGTIILVLGLLIMPFIKLFINGSYPNTINLYLMYLLYLLNSVVSYYLFSYKECLLIADQRTDILKNIRTVVDIVRYIFQFIILLLTKNFYYYLIVAIIGTIITNLCIEIITRKNYPYYKRINKKLKLPTELKKQVGGLMINKICDTFRNSFDSLIISAFIGLISTTIYSNYYYIFNAIYSIMLVICGGMSASIGNSIVKNSVDENYNAMEKFYLIYTMILGIFTACLCCLYQPFMTFWAGEDLLLSEFNMILFCVYFYLINMNNIRNQYISGTGIWWKLKKSYILEAVANLLLNILLGKILGITGIILATIITIFLFNYLDRNNCLFKNYFKNKSQFKFYKNQIYYSIIVFIGCACAYIVCNYITKINIIYLILKGLIAVTISTIIILIGFKYSNRYNDAKEFICNNILKKIKLRRKN